MEVFEIQSNANELIIRLDKNLMPSDTLLKVAKRLQIEYLAQKAGYDGSLLEVAEEIDENWWKTNGEDFLKNISVNNNQ
ncbi:MAG: hypothetical protein OHK0053_13970 [Microscillaceae bacterium]